MQLVDRIGIILLWAIGAAALMVGCGTSPPTVPENLVVEATSDTTIEISWDESTDYGEVDRYIVYRSGDPSNETDEDLSDKFPTEATEYIDTALKNSTTYCYRVAAEDGEGNRSEKSKKECDTTWATATDTQSPTKPADLVAEIKDSMVYLAWTESTDNTSVELYYIYHGEGSIANAAFVGSSVTNSYSHVGIDTLIVHCYIVNAVDGFGNESSPSNEACTNP